VATLKTTKQGVIPAKAGIHLFIY